MSTWLPISFSLGSWDGWGGARSSVAVPISGSFPPCQLMNTVAQNTLCSFRKWQFCWRSGFVKQTLFFPPFSRDFFFTPSSPHAFPGTLPRTTLVPFSPTKGTKNFFYWPTGCSGYKEVKLIVQQGNSPLQAGPDELQEYSRKGFKRPPSSLPQGSVTVFSYTTLQCSCYLCCFGVQQGLGFPQEWYLMPRLITLWNKHAWSLCLLRKYNTFVVVQCEV